MEILEVLKKHPEWQFELGGFGGDEKVILEVAPKLPNVRFHGRVSYEQALELYAEADVLVATYDPSIANHRYSSPNKLFEAMMLGEPIIVAKGSGIDSLVQKHELGFVVEYGNLDQLEHTLSIVASWDSQTRARFAYRCRSVYAKHYSWEQSAEKLVALYARICSPPGECVPVLR